ncbi:MAG TPA: 50S ribosomal protein L11 methyltransferase [Planctomycetota bacterium]|nr:50S ribosomal protein L11 methyltransferase [Planctomycetota bacterium]
MSDAAPLRAFRLTGPGAAAALDRLHVHADVAGVLEQDAALTVWLRGALPDLEALAVVATELPAEVAAAAATGLEHDRAIVVVPGLLVRPPWVPRPAGYTGIELVVPRAMAFGSGEHASTQAALRCLHAHWRAPASFADIGTGSGILALYATVRGCPHVLACDVDPLATAAAAALLPGATVTLGGAETLPAAADCVVANLTCAELLAALPAILAKWNRRAPLVLAGTRGDEPLQVQDRMRRPPNGRITVGDFHGLVFDGC